MRRRIRGGFMMPRVHRIRKGGAVFKYHRVTRAPLPNDVSEDHPRFIAAWQAQERGEAPARTIKGSVSEGCAAFLASQSFKELSDGYRPVIRRHVDAIRKQCDAAKVPPMLRDLRPGSVSVDLEPLKPAVAASRLKAWRKLADFWQRTGATKENVSAGVRRKPIPKSEGHIEWLESDLEQFRARWDEATPQRLALELLQWTGARCVDLVGLGRKGVQPDGVLAFHQAKTDVIAYVPWEAPAFGLERQRETLLNITDDTRETWLQTKHGKRRSPKSVSQWFSAAATDAGLPHLSAHGLRKYRMNQLAEHGVSVLGMQSWVGHVTLQEVEHYTKRAQRRNVFFVNQPRLVYNEGK